MALKELLSSLLPDDREGKLGMGAGATLFALGIFDRDGQRAQVLKVAGAAVVAYFFLRDQDSQFASKAEIEKDAELPAGNAGVSLQESYNAFVGRFLGFLGVPGTRPEAGIQDKPDRAADESKGPFLGQPKNVLRIAGAWRQPIDGGTVPIATFSDTFQAFAVLENQSAQEVAGQVRVRILHQGLLQSEPETTMFDGPSLRLAPGELRELDMRLPVVRDADGKIELALLFAGYNLASITAQRSFVLA